MGMNSQPNVCQVLPVPPAVNVCNYYFYMTHPIESNTHPYMLPNTLYSMGMPFILLLTVGSVFLLLLTTQEVQEGKTESIHPPFSLYKRDK